MFGDFLYRRGDVYELKANKAVKGHEQAGKRYCVILQSDDLLLSTVVVAPTSTGRASSSFRPEIEIDGIPTRILVDQIASIDPEQRLGRKVTHLKFAQMEAVSNACKLVLEL